MRQPFTPRSSALPLLRARPLVIVALATGVILLALAFRPRLDDGASSDAERALPGGQFGRPPLPPEPAMSVAPMSGAAPMADVVATGAATDASIGFAAKQAAPPTLSVAPTLPQRVADSTAAAMIIRTGQASVEVDSLALGLARVRELARRLGGLVANTSVQSGRDELPSATIELRLPASRFDEALDGLAPMGRVESVNVSAQDVGEEFVDVNARLANARRLEERLLSLLATRTGRLADVVSVERELARVREEIERYEGRVRYLRAHVAMSTLAITVHEPAPIASRPGAHPMRDAVRLAWRNFVALVAGFIASLGILIPVGAVAAIAFVVVRRKGWLAKRPAVAIEQGGAP
jgi:hypothetical protein